MPEEAAGLDPNRVDPGHRFSRPRFATVALLGLFVAAVAAGLWQFSVATQKLEELDARMQAETLGKTILLTREVYTRHVVERAERGGCQVTDRFERIPTAIPLPATFTHLLGDALSRALGHEVRLISPYSWRADRRGGLRDGFQREAWLRLSADGEAAYSATERTPGRSFVRYALADRMQRACIGCHNLDSRSPKRDWQPGDLAGILDVRIPLDVLESPPARAIRWILVVCCAVFGAISFLLAGALSALDRLRKAKERAEFRFELFARGSRCGIVAFGPTGGLLSLNPEAMRIFARSDGPRAGEMVTSLLPDCRDPVESVTGGAMRTGGPWTSYGIRSDGREVPIELTVTGIITDQRSSYVAIVKDLTEILKLQEMRDRFVSTITHELKSPITVMSFALEVLKTELLGRLTPKSASLLEMITTRCAGMRQLVNDILTYEKCQAGREALDLQPVDLRKLTLDLASQYQLVAQLTRVEIVLGDGVSDTTVHADQAQLSRAIENLLSNSVKYSRPGGEVHVRVEEVGGRVRASFSDSGMGIPEDVRPDIFTRYGAVAASSSRLMPSSGLGLSLTKAIISQHGGTVGFETQLGRGTTFYLELPRYEGARLPASGLTPPRMEAEIPPPASVETVLIEEHRTIRTLLDCLDSACVMAGTPRGVPAGSVSSLLDTLEEYANGLHDLREEMLFSLLLQRASRELQDVVKVLRVAHLELGPALADVDNAHRQIQGRGARGVSEFVIAAQRYRQLMGRHLQREEDMLFPRLDELLSPENREVVERWSRDCDKQVSATRKAHLERRARKLAGDFEVSRGE